jgi:hypothetical protein
MLIAVGLGAVIGCILGAMVTPSYNSFRWGNLWCESAYRNCIYLLQGYWLLILFWTALGGALGGGIVYVRQLLRA